METLAGQYTKSAPIAASPDANTMLAVQVNNKGELIIVGDPLSPVPVTISSVVGSVTYGAPTAVAVTAGPTSTTLVAANAARKTLSIWNPIGNAQMSVDVSGGTAALITGRPLLAGDSIDLTDDDCPVGAVTFIGTAGQSLVYQQGT